MMKGKDGNRLKGRRVYWTWLVSYLLVLVLLLGVWLGNMAFSRSIIIRQARQLNTSRMTLLQTMADAAVKQVTSVTLSAATDSRIKRLLQGQQRTTPQDMQDVRDSIDLLATLKARNALIADIIVYFAEGDFVVTSETVADFSLFYAMKLNETGYTAEAYHTFLRQSQRWRWGIVNCYNRIQTTNVFCLSALPLQPGRQPRGALAVLLRPTALTSFIALTETDAATHIWIESADGQILADNGTVLPAGRAIDTVVTGGNGWRFCMTTPESTFLQASSTVQQRMYLSAAFVTVLCLLVIHYFMRKNYAPICELTHHLEQGDGIRKRSSQENEYAYLKASVQTVLQDRHKNRQIISYQQQKLRESYLLRLAHGHGEAAVGLEEYLSLLQVPYQGQKLAIALLEDDSEQSPQLLGHCLELPAYCLLCAQEAGRVLCLLACDTRESLEAQGREMLMALQPAAPDLLMGFSDLHEGTLGVAQAYDEAVTALEYAQAVGVQPQTFYSQLAQGEEKPAYDYSPETERQLLSVIAAGKTRDVQTLLESLYQANGSLTSTRMQRLFLLDLLSTLTKAHGDTMDLVQQVLRAQPEEFPALREGITVCAIAMSEESSQTHTDEALKERILAYIAQHYTNPDLGVEDICREFGRSRSGLFNLFKQATGSGLMTHITRVRIDAAKQLLAAGTSVNETAQAVGYASVNTFMRAFKKQTGIAPGSFKEIQGENTEKP